MAKEKADKDAFKWHFGDRSDGRRLHDIDPMNRVATFIMPDRIGSMNLFRDSVPLEPILKYVHAKRNEGYAGFGIMHVLAAAYVRVVSQKPGINRFLSGFNLYARRTVQMILTIKKEMKLDGEETNVKFDFERDATIFDVYKIIQTTIDEAKTPSEDDSGIDTLCKVLNHIPRCFLRLTINIFKLLDYFGLLPKTLLKLSPFHGSVVITSMGSLGIPPIFHHLYNFGNAPVFIAFSAVRHENVLAKDGTVKNRRFLDFTVSTDERTVDGFYYAAAFHDLVQILKHPEVLDNPPEEVIEDVR